MIDELEPPERRSGIVKWYDPIKGFGFVSLNDDHFDALLHANVLQNFGRSKVSYGARIVADIQDTGRGLQIVEIHSIRDVESDPDTESYDSFVADQISARPVEPMRVKWFDKEKGFGFVNVLGREEDVFLHIEVLRHSGFEDLQAGEAGLVRLVEDERGNMAIEVLPWEAAHGAFDEPDPAPRAQRRRYINNKADKFDLLREFDELLEELVAHIRSINDPDVLNKDLRYIKAAAESLQSFIDAQSETEKVEFPHDLPMTFAERLKSADWSKVPHIADKLSVAAQRILDMFFKIF